MDHPDARSRPTGRRRAVVYAIAVALNLALGYAAVAPVGIISYVVTNTFLTGIGLAVGDSTFDDGAGLPLAIAGFLAVFTGLVVLVANLYLHARAEVSAPGLWAVAVVAVATPSAISLLWYEAWRAIAWY